MKNFIRVCAGLAAVFLVPGILCMVMGTALGGSWSEAMRYTSVGNGRYGVQLLGWNDSYVSDWGEYYAGEHHGGWAAPEAPEAPEPPQAPTAPTAPGATELRQRLGSYNGLENRAPETVAKATKLEFELSGTKEIQIIPAEGFGLYDEGDVGTLTTRMDGSTWKVETNHRRTVAGTLYVLLPEGAQFTEIELMVGAGGITGSGLSADKLEATAGAGAVDLTGVWARKLELTAEAGSISVQGEVTQKAELDAQAGYIYLLTPKPADYGYKIECSMGSVSIDGDNYSALSSSVKHNSHAATMFDVDCSVGSVEVAFE